MADEVRGATETVRDEAAEELDEEEEVESGSKLRLVSGAEGPQAVEDACETTDSGRDIGDGVLESGTETEEGETRRLDCRVTRFEVETGESDGESVSGEKEPGI